MTPTHSISISACFSGELLGECLRNLSQQTNVSNCEIILINSGSSEADRAIAKEYQHLFKAFVYVETPRESLYEAWNRALEMARGEFFVNANTDDSLHPQALDKFTRALADHPRASLAYCDWLWAESPNLPPPWPDAARVCCHASYEPWMPLFYAYAGCHQFWRTSKLRELGGFDASYSCAGDYEILCRLAERGGHAVHVPETLSAFYQNPSGLSRSSGHSLKEFYRIRDRFRARVGIGQLADVDESDHEACAAAWTGIARRALELYVPWATHRTPDEDYAEHCLARALELDPRNEEARRLLAEGSARA